MKKILWGILIVVILLSALELSLRVVFMVFHWTPGEITLEKSITQNKLWQQQLFSSFLGVQQSDPYLLWKFKPHLNKHIFVTNSQGTLGPEYKTKKSPGTFRILLLGDSSPVGLGLPDRRYAFGEQFKALLTENLSNQKFELINAAVSGYTSAQGLLWYRKYGVKLKPDLVLIYFGNNDASYNGYVEDKEFISRPVWMVNLQELLSNFALYRTLRSILLPLKEKLLNTADSQPKRLKVRVSAEDYYHNIEAIASLAQQSGSKVMLMTVPVPRQWPPAIEFKPFVNLQTKAGEPVMAEESRNTLSQGMAYCLDWSEIKQKYPQIDYWTLNVLLQVYADTGNLDSSIQGYQQKLNAGKEMVVDLNNLAVLYWRKQNYLKSLQYITQAIALDSANAILHYNLGMLAKKLGDSLSASGEFEKAKELDFYSLRTKKAYNDKLKFLAQEQKISLVDLDSVFLAHDNEFLFIDHCHPKPEGHRLMAEALLEKFRPTGWMDALNKN